MVTVVGAGLSGLACARTLADAGVEVRVLERSRAVGGRLARVDCPPAGRLVDWGAAYLTGYGAAVAPLVDDWLARGLLRDWTATFAVAGPAGLTGEAPGPMRYRAPGGLRSLARDLAGDLPIEFGAEAVAVPEGTSVLALPRVQAERLAGLPEDQPWEAVTVVVAAFARRTWPDFRAAFVNGSDDLALLVDDGDRVGDGAPVLVCYRPGAPTPWPGSDPDGPAQADATLAAARRVLDLPQPVWSAARTWRLAQPAIWDERPFGHPRPGLFLVGDGWAGKPRIGAALTSGISAARAILTG